jgi:hypothetical protein
MKLAGVLLAGLIVGRFGLPRIEPQTTYYVSIASDPGQRSCGFAMIWITTVLGRRTEYGEGTGSLNCREEKAFSNTVLDCRCPDTP